MSSNMLGRIVELIVTAPSKEYRGALVDLLEKLTGTDSAQWFRELKHFLRKEVCWVELRKNLNNFFTTRPGLYVDESFRRLVLPKAKPAVARVVNHFDLSRDMSDGEIEKKLDELYGPHIWDESDLCVTIQKMIEEQEGGKSDKLLNNGYANLFYTNSCVVSVHWLADDREWFVSAWQRDDDRWYFGFRAFSPVQKEGEACDGEASN